MKNFIVILLSLTLLFNCKKDGELNLTVNQYTRRLEGQWQIVSYKLNEENTLSFKEFLTSYFSFYLPKQSTLLLFPLDCESCEFNTWGLFFDYSNEFAIPTHRSDSLEVNSDTNPLAYRLSDSTFSTKWKIRTLNKRYFDIDNFDTPNRKENIEIRMERH